MSLNTTMTTALSGMQAQSTRLASVADNIANLDTQGYKKATTQLAAQPAGGVAASVSRPAVTDPDADSDVDPATEILDMIDAETSFKANLAAFETGASLWDALLGVKRD
jgi:flagellar basal-body rod protein FlgC